MLDFGGRGLGARGKRLDRINRIFQDLQDLWGALSTAWKRFGRVFHAMEKVIRGVENAEGFVEFIGQASRGV
jgi:hypothetical protein